MNDDTDERILSVLTDIRNWIRAATYRPVRALLEEALPDEKSRAAYQMLDGAASTKQVRIACKMSPNAVVALTNRCIAMGIMDVNADNKRVRLFDLNHFGLSPETNAKAEDISE